MKIWLPDDSLNVSWNPGHKTGVNSLTQLWIARPVTKSEVGFKPQEVVEGGEVLVFKRRDE